MGVQLRSAASQVQRFHLRFFQKGNHLIDDYAAHNLLGAIWPGVDMAMEALLIAEITQIGLQGFQVGAPDGWKFSGFAQGWT